MEYTIKAYTKKGFSLAMYLNCEFNSHCHEDKHKVSVQFGIKNTM